MVLACLRVGELTTIIDDLLGDMRFLAALGVGALLAGTFYAIRRSLNISPRGWALAYGGAALVVLGLTLPLDLTLVLRLGLVAGAGLLVDLTGLLPEGRWRLASQVVAWALVAFSVYVFTTEVTSGLEPWIQVTLPLWMVALAVAMRAIDRSSLAALLAPALAVLVVGIWVTVPETDMMEVLLGASLPMALVTLPPIGARTTTSGLLLVAALLGWLTVDGGAGRVVGIAGSLSMPWVLLIVPLVMLIRPQMSRASTFVVHLVFVVVATRLVDWLPSTSSALFALAVLGTAALLVLFLLSPITTETTRAAVPDR
jgi:hypothetical protein